MKRAFILFLLLFAYMVGGTEYAQASVSPAKPDFLITANLHHAGHANNASHSFLTLNTNLSQESLYPADIENEDEEEFSRKRILLAKFLVGCAVTLLSAEQYNNSSDGSFHNRNHAFANSSIYIIHRVLRI